MTQIRKRGCAGVVICSTPFRTLATGQARVNGVPDLPLVLIDHPLGGLAEDQVLLRVEQALPQVMAHLKELAAP